MSHRRIRSLLSLVIAVAMTVGMSLSAAHVSAGHSAYAMAQAEILRHAELAASIAEHGHSHEEGEADERLPGHVHGHNTADHVHETGDVVDDVPLAAPRFVRTSIRPEPLTSSANRPGGLERPPRSVVA